MHSKSRTNRRADATGLCFILCSDAYVCNLIIYRQEIDRIQRVNQTVYSTLCDLKLAIDGTIVMSQGLRESLDAMYDARIPQTWLKVRLT